MYRILKIDYVLVTGFKCIAGKFDHNKFTFSYASIKQL